MGSQTQQIVEIQTLATEEEENNSKTEQVGEEILTLPLFSDMTDLEVAMVIRGVTEWSQRKIG